MVNNFVNVRLVILLLAGYFFGSSVGKATTIAEELSAKASASDVYSTTTEKMTESVVKSSTDENAAKNEDEPLLPVDLLSEVGLFDPNIVLARATRDIDYVADVYPPSSLADSPNVNFDDDIPTFYLVKLARMSRSLPKRLVPEKTDDFRLPEQREKGLRRLRRDLDTAADGFIVRPLFKYRHEQYKRRNRQGYKNKDVYSIYNRRNPVFSGK